MPATPQTTEARAIVDPFRLFEKATTSADEGRNVAARMRAFPTDEGNLQYLRKLIYEDSATLVAMIPDVEAAAGAESEVTRNFYQAASICGSVGECSGNTQMWPLMVAGADAVDAACAAVDGGGAPPPGGGTIETPPAAVEAPVVTQAGGVLSCSEGSWSGAPTGYAYQWRMDAVAVGSGASSYILNANDIGRYADCLVTATNGAGSAGVASNALLVELPTRRR